MLDVDQPALSRQDVADLHLVRTAVIDKFPVETEPACRNRCL
jgi:hypothetical protein